MDARLAGPLGENDRVQRAREGEREGDATPQKEATTLAE